MGPGGGPLALIGALDPNECIGADPVDVFLSELRDKPSSEIRLEIAPPLLEGPVVIAPLAVAGVGMEGRKEFEDGAEEGAE
jgi:hypothetical protein